MKKIALLTCLFLLAACSPNVETRGYVAEDAAAAAIQPGVTTKGEVAAALGSPSSVSTFGPETWYYITTTRESFAFLAPEVTQRQIKIIRFDASGVVEAMDMLDGSQARQFAYAERITPTEGHQLTFMEQILGNMGRFNSPAGVGSGVGGPPRR